MSSNQILTKKQAEVEVVPSSSLVEVEVEAEAEVGVGVEVEVGVVKKRSTVYRPNFCILNIKNHIKGL